MAIPFSSERAFLSPRKYVVGEQVAVRQPHGIVLGKVEGWAINGFERNKVKVVVNFEHATGNSRAIKAGKIRPLK